MQRIPNTIRRIIPFAILATIIGSLVVIFVSFSYTPATLAQSPTGELPTCRAGLEALRTFEEPEPVAPVEPTEAPTVDPNAPTATPEPPPPTPRPAPTEDRIGFPENYTEEYKLMFVFDRASNQQVRAICGNEIAAQTQEGEPFAYGSVLVMETWNTKKDDEGVALLDENGHYIREQLTGAFIQAKEEGFGEAYLEDRSGEWEYVAYRPDGSAFIPPERTNACAACHLSQGGESVDFVFRMDLMYEGEDALTPPETADNEVAIHLYAFKPSTLTVEAGTTVTWINYDESDHIVESNDGLFESETLKTITIMPEGDRFSFTFDEPGTYEYFSAVQRAMTGVIEVVEASD